MHLPNSPLPTTPIQQDQSPREHARAVATALRSAPDALDRLPDAAGVNLYELDHDLRDILSRALSAREQTSAEPLLRALGALAGGELSELARQADAHPPQLVSHDRQGNRTDEIMFHPSYERMTEIAVQRFGLVAMSHVPTPGFSAPVSHPLKYAFWYLFVQAEFALACPLSMTDAAIRVLQRFGDPELNARYAAPMLRTDAGFASGAQFMTERQGGSDVGANAALARLDEDGWRLHGAKWFCSNASADVALVLARPEGAQEGTAGLAMFLMPRFLPNGERNCYRIERLKDKLGTRAMASGEIQLNGATAYPVGELGTGFSQMMSMVNASRLSNAMRSAALMRRSLVEALHSARERWAFGGPLLTKPLMRDTLLRMVVASEAATAMVFRTAEVYERADRALAEAPPSGHASSPQDSDSRLLRILTPIVKGVICKRARTITSEGMEVRGGNGYIEEWGDARRVRDAHIGSIWEGTTSIVALDVQRALLRNHASGPLFDEIRAELACATRTAPHSDVVRALAELLEARTCAIEARVDELGDLTSEHRDLGAAGLMNALYDLFSAALLLGQAAVHLRDTGNARKLAILVAALRPHPLSEPRFEPAATDVLLTSFAEAILCGGQVPAEAVDPAVATLLENIGAPR